jgi:uncharacterized membrane protein
MSTFEAFVGQGEKKATGAIHELYEIQGEQDLVVKRIMVETGVEEKLGSREAVVERVKEEHEFTASYLSGFVPKTTFIESDLGRGQEWFMVQEKVSGATFQELELGFDRNFEPFPSAPEHLRIEYLEFRERYRRMRNAGRVIEDQVMVDFELGKIWAYDTNSLRSSEQVRGATEIFAMVGDQPESSKAEDIIIFLRRHFQSVAKINTSNQEQFLKQLRPPFGEVYVELLNEVKTLFQQRGSSLDEIDIMNQVQMICASLVYFPPKEFEDNTFTLTLKEMLGL